MKLLIDKTSELFTTPEQWDNYLELAALKDGIVENWKDCVKKQVLKYFQNTENQIGNCFPSESRKSFDWYLQNCDRALAICLWDYRDFGLWIDEDKVDHEKANKLVKEEKYKKIWNLLRNDEVRDKDWIFYESGNFYFEGAFRNGNFHSAEEIIWCAKHNTNSYISQIKEKLEAFLSEENRQLIQELYQEIKL